jgi:hypothetical protein
MAGFTLSKCEDYYPIGTSVGAYLPAQRRPYRPDGGGTPVRPAAAPEGAAVESQVVTAGGQAAFVALAASTKYVLYALVGGVHRYVSIISNAT